MSIETWLAFSAASAVLLVIPGPTILLVMSYALGQGMRAALPLAVGVGLGDLTAMTLSMLGVGALLATSAMLFTILKWIGAAYLVYLGIRLWRSKPQLPDLDSEPAGVSTRGIFGHAFVVTALNPKSLAFFVAFVPQFIAHDAPLLPQLAIMEATFVTLAALNALIYALAADQLRLRIRRPEVLTWLNRTGAGCLVGMGVATAALSRT